MATIVKDLGAVTAYAYAKEKGYTGTEDEFAELMASYADVAEQAAESAAQAGASAAAAEQAKAEAVLSASAAASSSSTASTKASEAASSASSAAVSANTATTKANEASTSATNAASSASAAATSATNAGASETAAASSATAASNAQTAAETAQGKAEDAQTAAEDAAASVSASAAQITQNTEDVADLKSALESNQPNVIRTLEVLSIPDGDTANHDMSITDMDQTYENFVEITNTGSEEAYYSFQVFWNGNPTAFSFYEKIAPGATKTYEIPVRQNIRTRTLRCICTGGIAGTFVLKRVESPYVESLKAQGVWICDAAANGFGIYQSIENAVKWMKKSAFYTGKTKQCVLYIRNGVYTIDPALATADTFWSVILTAQHDVAFIGESRDQTIIQMTCPTGAAARIFDISGNSRLAHLTIKNLAGDGYSGGAAGHNPYAVHIDSNNTGAGYERTVVEDCYIYSSMFNPVGAGLGNKQTQLYRNCVFEFAATYSGFQSWGALYIHGPSQASATECALEIDNCTMISTNGQKALTLPDVAGSLQYTDIPVTIQRCIGYSSNPNNLTDVSASRVALTPQSALNNVERWNA